MNFSKIHLPTALVGLVSAIFMALAPMLALHKFEWWVLIPAAAVAASGFLQKEQGAWQTTMGGILVSGVLSVLTTISNPNPDWLTLLITVGTTFFSHYMPQQSGTGGVTAVQQVAGVANPAGATPTLPPAKA
jgi:prepilin signal peptidase PulO-like enzyme (type II secretory pathway)